MNPENNESKLNKYAPNLSGFDVAALFVCWSGAAGVAWISKEPVVIVVALAAAYYLAKWIILKKRD